MKIFLIFHWYKEAIVGHWITRITTITFFCLVFATYSCTITPSQYTTSGISTFNGTIFLANQIDIAGWQVWMAGMAPRPLMFLSILSSTYVSMCVPASWRHGVDLEVPCCAAVQLPSVRSHQPRATHATQCEYQEHRVANDLNITLSVFYTYSVLPIKMFLQIV